MPGQPDRVVANGSDGHTLDTGQSQFHGMCSPTRNGCRHSIHVAPTSASVSDKVNVTTRLPSLAGDAPAVRG
jgi:hypothetical protein